MPSERRYADWRPVAVRRMPARWIGILVGTLAGTIVSVLWHRPSYVTYSAAIWLGAYVSNRVAARRLEALRDEGGDRQFGATLRLKRETVYGHDEGLVSFEDGYLVYMGRRCAFSLGSRDVRITKQAKNELEFRFRGPGGKHTAHLELSGNEGFLAAVLAWKETGRYSEESVLPPAQPDPSLASLAIAAMNALPLLALSAVVMAMRPKPLSEKVYITAISLTLLACALLFALTQYLTLGRITRGEARTPSFSNHWRRWRKARKGRHLTESDPLRTALGQAPNLKEEENAQPTPLTDRA